MIDRMGLTVKSIVGRCVLVAVSVLVASTGAAQVRPVYDIGATGLVQALKRLNTSASAMMIGAHPDDEDTALLTYLARGENARTAYLSLTRGDGGQNIIGPELGEALGVIRTEELLQARRLDGAEQYFTRAYDYGFSKTLAEARSKWPEAVVLCDAVRAIRNFRPLIVVSQFSGTPADGHGQHQYSGYIAPLAVKAAGDPAQCKDSGTAWVVKRFFVRHGFRATGQPQLSVNTGRFDPVLGRSYFEIAMEARSQHKSQEQGVLELKGEMFSGLNMPAGEPVVSELFSGIDLRTSAIGAHSGDLGAAYGEAMRRVETAAAMALSEIKVTEPEKILQRLVSGLAAAEEAAQAAANESSRALAEFKVLEFQDAIMRTAGLQIDAIASRETVVPESSVDVSIRVFLPEGSPANVQNAELKFPSNWKIESKAAPAEAPQRGFFRRERATMEREFTVTVPFTAIETEPYWLREPRSGDLFIWPSSEEQTKPFQSPIASADVTVEVGGRPIVFSVPVEYRFADDVRGEVRRSLNVVPALTLELDRELLIVPAGGSDVKQTVNVSVTNNSEKTVDAVVLVETEASGPIGIRESRPVKLTKRSEKVTTAFEIVIPKDAPPGSYRLVASAATNDGLEITYRGSQRTIEYPHIQTHRIYANAGADVRVLDVKTADVRVGYITGSGDRTAEAISSLGKDVRVITSAELASGDLSQYDTIVVGVRAYQVRPDLAANNRRLIEFMEAGGTLVVQYQLSAYTQQNLAPFPAQQGPRTSDELAEVKLLRPDHPVLRFPNKIGPADFEGWVQERNLYNFGTMDSRYTGLLETHDAGEAENTGGLVVATVGKGRYIYCSYSLFRQLPAGVPGAYRLLANMISLPKADVAR